MTTSLIIPVGICSASVCSDEPVEDITLWLNTNHPTGIRSEWELSRATHFASPPDHTNPCPCEVEPSRTHYLFEC